MKEKQKEPVNNAKKDVKRDVIYYSMSKETKRLLCMMTPSERSKWKGFMMHSEKEYERNKKRREIKDKGDEQ